MKTTTYAYHCSPVAIDRPVITVSRTLCLADSDDAAKLYRRGGMESTHYLYEAKIEANLADESDIHELAANLGITIHEGLEYEAMKHERLRQAILDAGFDGAQYGDTCDGCDYQCFELLRVPGEFQWALSETLCDEDEDDDDDDDEEYC